MLQKVLGRRAAGETNRRLPRHRPATPAGADEERHATNLELFVDLVFVFAVTQIATLAASDLSAGTVGRAALAAWLVWWLWSQFAWAGAAVNLQREPFTRVLVLVTVPATLLMAAAIPDAFGSGGRWFGGAYLGVQLLVLAMMGDTAMRAEETRAAFVRYASVAAVAPVLICAGGWFAGDVRLVLWCVAAALDVIGALRGASGGGWTMNPVHFTERHALFVIISLGEALVAIGAGATSAGLSWQVVLGLAVAAGECCVLWWTYFAFVPDVTEHVLRQTGFLQRGMVARDLFTFGHFPIVVGIVCFGVVARHLMPAPAAPLPGGDRVLLALSTVWMAVGFLGIQWRLVRRLSSERILAAVAVCLLCAAGGPLAGWLLVTLVTLVLGASQAVTWRRFRSHPLAEARTNL